MEYVTTLDALEWTGVATPGVLGAEFAFSPDVIAEDYTSAYRAQFARITPGGRSDTHVDPHNHAFFVVSGRGAVQIDDEVLTMAPGSVVKVPRGHPHSLRNTGDDDLVFLTIFDPPRRPARS
jgi:mannose-6-phosphate isomerase-like protein (cupin superfamily)